MDGAWFGLMAPVRDPETGTGAEAAIRSVGNVEALNEPRTMAANLWFAAGVTGGKV